jgi:hypothetical protein
MNSGRLARGIVTGLSYCDPFSEKNDHVIG